MGFVGSHTVIIKTLPSYRLNKLRIEQRKQGRNNKLRIMKNISVLRMVI